MKCPNCGADSANKFCPYCGSEMPYRGPENVTYDYSENQTIINNYYIEQPVNEYYYTYDSAKSKWVAFFLCLFFGYFGAHYFYVGRHLRGIVFFFTVGLFGLGYVIDIFSILFGVFKDSDGKMLK